MISPPTFSFLACLSVITPFDVETNAIPNPFKTLGNLVASEYILKPGFDIWRKPWIADDLFLYLSLISNSFFPLSSTTEKSLINPSFFKTFNIAIFKLDEETTVDLSNGFSCQYLTTFTDDREDVSKVHVCLLAHIKLESDDVDIKETEKLKGKWLTVEEVEQCKNIEGWSEIALGFIKDVI